MAASAAGGVGLPPAPCASPIMGCYGGLQGRIRAVMNGDTITTNTLLSQNVTATLSGLTVSVIVSASEACHAIAFFVRS